MIDGVLGNPRVSGGVSAGTYLILAALNRVCDPRSKAGFAAWWATTALGRITKIPAVALNHRRFWDVMDRVDAGQLDRIEAALTRRMIEVFGLDTHALILDMTNFATFIDSTNPTPRWPSGGRRSPTRSPSGPSASAVPLGHPTVIRSSPNFATIST